MVSRLVKSLGWKSSVAIGNRDVMVREPMEVAEMVLDRRSHRRWPRIKSMATPACKVWIKTAGSSKEKKDITQENTVGTDQRTWDFQEGSSMVLHAARK